MAKACNACVVSKVKCDGGPRPCQRCTKRKIECKTEQKHLTSPAAKSTDTITVPQRATEEQSTLQDWPLEVSDMGQTFAADSSTTWNSSFFEQIMAPDFVANEGLNVPHDLFSLMPDTEWLTDTTDIFGLDFAPTVDQAFEAHISSLARSETRTHSAIGATGSGSNDAATRHAIFLRSPWLWKPEANSNTLSEHGELSLDETQLDMAAYMAASPNQAYLPSAIPHDGLSDQSRDLVFQFVMQMTDSHISMPRFVSKVQPLCSALQLDCILSCRVSKKLTLQCT